MSPIKDFKIKYQAVNKENTFFAGDTVVGTVTFTLTEDTKVKSVYVKVKGDARVHWTESHGHGDRRRRRSYTAHKRYYKVKEFLVAESKDGTTLSRGDHCYKFQLKIPEGNIPPSFKGYHGKIAHLLQAKMSRSWHVATTDQKDLYFMSHCLLPFDQFGKLLEQDMAALGRGMGDFLLKTLLMKATCGRFGQWDADFIYLCDVTGMHKETPQAGSVEKSVGTFSKGQVRLNATLNKRVCSPGDTLMVTANITNNTSKTMRIKFKIDQKTVYRATHHAKIVHGNLCKIVGDTIEPDYKGDVSCSVSVPPDAPLSINNCEIINVEYYLKAYLDISLGADPEVVFPLIIAVPNALAQHGSRGFTNPTGPSSSDFAPPFPGPYPVPTAPGNAYPYPAPGPYPNPNMAAGGYYNPAPGYNFPVPQQPVPYGSPSAPVMPYPVLPQANSTYSSFPQDQAPPNYMSLFPPSQQAQEPDQKSQL